MLVTDQPEEGTMLALKRREYDMDCYHCTMRTRVREKQSTSGPDSGSGTSSSINTGSVRSRRRVSHRSTYDELPVHRHCQRDVVKTVRYQLDLALHNTNRHLPHSQLLSACRHIIAHSAHDLPPPLQTSLDFVPAHETCIESFLLTNCMCGI